MFFLGRKPIAGTLYNVNILFCSLTLTHKPSADSSSLPRHSPMHSRCSHIKGNSCSLAFRPLLPASIPPVQHCSHAAIPAPHQRSWTHLFQADTDPPAGTHCHRNQNVFANTSSATSCWHAVSASSFLRRFPSKERLSPPSPAGPPCP